MSTARGAGQDILAEENAEKREEIVELLKKAYWMEIETVMSYIANSINPDGVRAQEIIEERSRRTSMEFEAEQSFLQPGGRPTSST